MILKWLIPRRGKPQRFSVYAHGYLSYLIYLYYRQKGFFDEVFRSIYYAILNPSFEVGREYRELNVSRLKRIRPYDYEKVLRALGEPSHKFYGYESVVDYGTNENRFVAFFLDRLIFDMESLRRRIQKKVKEDVIDELRSHINRFYYLRNRSFLKDIPKFPGFTPSEKLIYNPKYHRIFKLFSEYWGNLINFNPVRIDTALLEDWRIFELYVILKVVSLIKRKYGNFELKIRKIDGEMPPDEIFRNWTFVFEGLKVYYQRYVENIVNPNDIFSVSIPLKPDIIIEKDGKFYVLDAKYKDDPEDKDFRQIHTYRDAIRKKDGDRYKRVVRYAVLVYDTEVEIPSREEVLTRWETIRRAKVGYVYVSDLKRLLRKLKII